MFTAIKLLIVTALWFKKIKNRLRTIEAENPQKVKNS